LEKDLFIQQALVTSLLSYSQGVYPQEGILLLRGKTTKDKIVVNDTVIPPLATHGEGFSFFPLFPLPMDLSIVGVAHSHPSGGLKPSVQDLNSFYGRIMVITAYPFQSTDDVAVYNRNGNVLRYTVV